MVCFFARDGDQLVARELAISHWSADQLSGPGVCGVLARRLETHCPDGFVPARLTVDLFSPVSNVPLEVDSDIVRRGRRIAVADASIAQGGKTRVRATAVFLATGTEPPGRVWSPTPDLPMPPPGCVSPNGAPPLFKSGDRDWSGDFTVNQNADRKISWHAMPALVEDEPLTPFQHAAMVGDTTNHICHWGSEGAGYINADMTLTLARLPTGFELGLRADNIIAADGISIGTATLYDRAGQLGTCVVSTLSNARRQIDYSRFRVSERAG
ncbi:MULTISPECIES: acyl-CoA thioesterase domain-containing protein [Nocardia]|uniref:acyl-CoA thioesterase domain-containing protein n=1 Tax=Nocardia TaxID=1817 RepID=UPI000D692737|nr:MULTISPECIES: acyl-CoA thioesterase domain-containing protein [Nocardia]